MHICLISTYPPRMCGHAEIARHLAGHIQSSGRARVSIVAMVKEKSPDYGNEVIKQVVQENFEDYRAAAALINDMNIDVVMIQHEFSLFGGAYGLYLLEFLSLLRKPVMLTLHNVPKVPSGPLAEIVRRMISQCARTISISQTMKERLESVYHLDAAKNVFIPLGASQPEESPEVLKTALGVQNRILATTFGLLHQNKGIEDVIESLPSLVRSHPDFLYMVVGTTHPEIKRTYGEQYIQKVMSRVDQLHLTEHVRFVYRYVSDDELTRHLMASDLYITPYRTQEQLFSHTLVYAAYMGKAIISTPYDHAVEMLANGHGALVPYQNPEMLGLALRTLVENGDLRKRYGDAIRERTRHFSWPEVSNRYLQVAEALVQERG